MTLAEVMPIIDSLPRADKFELMKFILSKLAKDERLPSEAKPAATAKKKDALWDIVGMADGEDAEVARNHDKHLYGAE
jgi:hypothetical protein